MRVLYCNKYNYSFSGTEIYLFELMEMMKQKGHEVALFAMQDERGAPTIYDDYFVPPVKFEAVGSLWQKAKRAGRSIYSRQARKRIRAMIQDFRPDVAHVRNIYHHLTPSILWELKKQGVPILYHINDFKLLCPSYNLVSRGEVCERCKGGAFWHALRAECYPGFGSRFTLAAEAYAHDWAGSYRRCINRFLAPSRFVRDKFVEQGWNGDQFEVLPHFQRAWGCASNERADAPVLYFGRLSAEKGVCDLLRAMQQLPELQLVVAGDGAQRNELEALTASLSLANVEFVGHLGREKLQSLISESRFTVLPSHAYETFGKSILESYAFGRAVIASDLGSRRELVHDGQTGLLYQTGNIDQLANAMRLLTENPNLARTLGRNGWEMVQRQYTPESHYEKLLTIYKRTAAQERASRKKLLVTTTQAPPWTKGWDRPSDVPAKLKVAFIGGRGVISKYSGIESYYEEVGKRLVERGNEVTVYCRNYFTPPIQEHHGMRIVRLPAPRSKHLETVIHSFLSTVHAITQDFDLVHYHALGPALFSFIPRLFGKKTMVTVQGLDWQRKKWGRFASWVLRMGERASACFPDATMVVSQVLQRHYREEYDRQAFYVPNGGVIRQRRPPTRLAEWGLESDNYVLYLGRLSPEKNCHLLVEAYERLGTRVKLVLAGASSYCDQYSRALRAHASEKIKIMDWVSGDDLDQLLTNAMIFVLPSDLEGLSLALLDAMGAGICVVTSDIPENREVIDGAGFTFPKGDLNALAELLRFLLATPAMRTAAGARAQAAIRRGYQWAGIAEQIDGVYRSVMHGESAVELLKKTAVGSEIDAIKPAQGRIKKAI